MIIYLVRHGERLDTVDPSYKGWNSPLSDTGKEQAEQLALCLSDCAPTVLYSSCMLRALQTAEPISAQLGIPWHVWPVFVETKLDTWYQKANEQPAISDLTTAWNAGDALDFGDIAEKHKQHYPGRYYLLSEIPIQFPDSVLDQPFPWPDRWWVPVVGESLESGYSRASLAIAALRRLHGDDARIVVVAHGDCGDLMISHLLGLPPIDRRRFQTDHASLTTIDVAKESGESYLCTLNSTEHLPDRIRI